MESKRVVWIFHFFCYQEICVKKVCVNELPRHKETYECKIVYYYKDVFTLRIFVGQEDLSHMYTWAQRSK